MTKPLFEPSTPREVAGNAWGVSQLVRRPAERSLCHGWDISALDSCLGGSSQALPIWDGRNAPPMGYTRENWGWGGDCAGGCPPGAGNVPFDSVIYDSDGYFDYTFLLNGNFIVPVVIPDGLSGYYIVTANLEIGADTAQIDELNQPTTGDGPRFTINGDKIIDSYHGWWAQTGASPTGCYDRIYQVSVTAILYITAMNGPQIFLNLGGIPSAVLLRSRCIGQLLCQVNSLGSEHEQFPPP